MNDRDYVSFYDEKGRFKGLFAWIFSTDHKRIGLLYLYSIMVFFIIGIILGVLMGGTLADLIEIPLTVSVSPEMVIGVFFIAIFLGVLGGFYPAWRASKMSPVEALSRE